MRRKFLLSQAKAEFILIKTHRKREEKTIGTQCVHVSSANLALNTTVTYYSTALSRVHVKAHLNGLDVCFNISHQS